MPLLLSFSCLSGSWRSTWPLGTIRRKRGRGTEISTFSSALVGESKPSIIELVVAHLLHRDHMIENVQQTVVLTFCHSPHRFLEAFASQGKFLRLTELTSKVLG